MRKATGNGGNWIKNFAHADDYDESNGDSVLTFFEAQAIARTIARDGEASGGLITVAAASMRYARDLATRGGRAYNARLARIHLPPALLGKPVGLLTVRDLKDFRDGLLKGRTAGTVNRTISVLRAALELAAATDPRITNSAAFKVGLKKLPDAARARNVVLTDAGPSRGRAGLRREPRVRALDRDPRRDRGAPVAGGAADGCRPAGRPRPAADDAVVAQGQGRQADRSQAGADLGQPRRQAAAGGGRSERRRVAAGQARRHGLGRQRPAPPFRRVVENGRARSRRRHRLRLRHSSITRQLLRGVPTRVVAASHDTSVPMIEKCYSATIGDHSDALYRDALLDLGGRRRRQGGAAGPEGLTVADNTADGLTAEHRARIEAALPPEGKVMTPEAWAELEEFVVCYRILETRRTTYPIVEERKRWKRLGEAVDTVADELRREKLWANPDPTWRDRALTMLSEVRRKVELRALLHEVWGSPFSRRQNPHRKALYRGVMRVWTDHLAANCAIRSREETAQRPADPFPRGLCRAHPGRQDAGWRTRRHHRPRARGPGRHRGL